VVDYLCSTLGAIAAQLGAVVPVWDNRYLMDFHAPPDPEDADEEDDA
jgi:hypothetical protein